MSMSLDRITIGVADVAAARSYHGSVFDLGSDRSGDADLDLHSAGRLDPVTVDTLAADTGLAVAVDGFGGIVLNYIVGQPSEVEALTAAAERCGSSVLKPPKKGLFGGFSAVVQLADGTVWKFAAPTKKDTGRAENPPRPTEIVAILGAAEPKASKKFYESLGMTAERDYGNKFVDFEFVPGSFRLGLMPHRDLVKDAGLASTESGSRRAILTHRAGSPTEVDTLLAAAAAAGGQIAVSSTTADNGTSAGVFADPDGHLWKVTA